MKVFAVVLFLAVAASASHWDHGYAHHEAHIPSGSVSVGHDGVVIAGPSGSVHTDNGLHGHGAGARLSGPAGDVATHGGHAHLNGPGYEHEHHGHVGHAVHVVAAPHWGHGAWGHGAYGHGGYGHAVYGHDGYGHGAWGHGGVLSHGLVGHGHHGW